MNKTAPKIAFIGAGNMSSAVIGGMLKGHFSAEQIIACAPSDKNLKPLSEQFGVHTDHDNARACAAADVVVLGVKPQMLKQVAGDIKAHLAHKPLIISLAAGIPLASLSEWLGEDLAIVRSMPNTPSLVGVGAAGLYANDNCSAEQRDIAESIQASVGIVKWLEEEALIDSIIAVSGSGPAYFFLAMEAMINEGVQQGLDRDSATELTIQTVLGAATLAQNSNVDVLELRRRVTSPGGTTAQAIAHFEEHGLRELFSGAMQACSNRAREMAKELG
ncbi:pyrroline-5-carboxylate reductase [Pseudoteredinibacter isoporae]|uniref:Pyrroline-5-carboxylate reductase n=1 Tax=Pseudoteredinibacter isoporae TaxID=570281 RepID=A0A7X0MTU0_9GAMM|nr:pyrroline-5-carboxylate reductase [Pseudoteredinibacter isoporae]MBB6519901.1 pyrroline-5-carboxylate reductase [Pseudoteredinibacter isoporae]NHO85479.1 pyrroline-5-carboxylate reductase [Pseudoteredinibacter isoporae]NIB26069.1 pyrroline-5-carboxylate reductase [Pseudoteredinibacter isoporae]